jgi:transposase
MERAEAEAIYDEGREACVEFLVELSGRYERQIARLEGRIERLEAELRKGSDNSSVPPSADPGAGKRRRRGKDKRSGRSAGGQPGHRGRGRELFAADRVDEVVRHLPCACSACGRSLTEEHQIGRARRHQVAELPDVSVKVTEHRLGRRRCPDCGATTQAELPAEVGRAHFGARLQAAVGTLAAGFRLSRRQASELCSELFGCEISVGTVDAILQRAGEALAGPQRRLRAAVRGAEYLCVDETGWREGGEKRALWGTFTERHAALWIADSRHRDHARELLRDTEAIVSSDRWWAYDHLDPARRQVCWSHLLRDFRFHAEGLSHQREFGERALMIAEAIFGAWREFGAGGDRALLTERIAPLRSELRELLQQGARKSAKTRHHRRFARNLLKVWPALWTFVERDGVEPTNNAAERGLRHAVIYRKLSQGSRSERGKRTTERLLSAAITCRLQARSLFAYLAEVTAASIRGHPVPALA